MVDESPDSADVIVEFFGEGKRFPHQPRAALPERVVEALDVVGLPRIFADLMQLVSIENRFVGVPEVGVGFCVQVTLGQTLPQTDSPILAA